MEPPHVLLVTFPAQGHINPAIQFAKRLVRLNIHVTLATTVSAHRRMVQSTAVPGLSLAAFSGGYDDGFKPGDDLGHYMSELGRLGSQNLKELIVSSTEEKGYSFTCIVYSILIPWVHKVAREVHLPSALLWNQSATVLDIYYYYFYGYGDVLRDNIDDPTRSTELPGLPLLSSRDLPSFFSTPDIVYSFALPLFHSQFQVLLEEESERKPNILVNTFDALEHNALKVLDKFNLIPIGPLVPSAFLDGKDPNDKSFGVDLISLQSNDYIRWLNSKPESSVIYVAFGSMSTPSKAQMEEIARGLLDTGRPFLWVIRKKENGDQGKGGGEEDILRCQEEVEQQGKIVSWCSQVEVLSNPSLGCFVTHCGWNSSLESLVSGVPVVAFPQWTDQWTNAKLMQDVWKTGVRVNGNWEGLVEGNEIKRCVELVMGEGERGEEVRRNAKKWKELAKEAAIEGGSSDTNLKAFVADIGKRS